MILYRFLSLILLLLCLAPAAFAGAWPREEGAVFFSMQLRQNSGDLTGDPVGSVYLDYGFHQAATLGAKIEYDFSQDELDHMEFFGRWHMPEDSFPLRAALGLAIEGTTDQQRAVPTVHFGRGFETPLGQGWADLTLGLETPLEQFELSVAGFAQLGLRPYDHLMAMVSLDAQNRDGAMLLKALPAFAWEYSEDRYLNVEYTHVLEGLATDEVSLGLWLEF